MSKLQIKTISRGFSLIEVLLAVAIMSFGLLALASLQVSMIRSSADAKAQTIALGLAKDKLEDLKNYRMINEPTGTCVAANDSYQCITDSSAAETLNDVNGSLGGVNYNRTWTVARYTASAGAFSVNANDTQAYSGSVPRNEYKIIGVDVSWSDASGGPAKHVTLKDAVSALDPRDSAVLQKPNTSSSPRTAVARINNPGLVAGVIPIAVGGGTNSAATNPRPTVITGGNVVETRFDVLTYSGVNGGSADAQSRVETVMVGCKCDTATKPATTVRGYRPTYWNGKRYTVPELVPTSTASPDFGYSPPAGQQTSSISSQSTRCSICCRDHHDPVNTNTAVFSPYRTARTSAGVVTSPHQHFNATATGSPAITTGVYSEACRIIRADGFFRVATDMNNDYFGLLATHDLTVPANNATSALPDAFATKRYQSFVVDYVDERFTNTGATNFNTPLTTTATAALEGPQSITVASVTRSTDLNEPALIDITAPTQTKTLHSRGLFVDYLEQEAMDAVIDAKTLCPSQSGQVYSDCVLKVLPFTSINLTEIADWSRIITDPVNVTNNDTNTVGIKRAVVTGKASPQNSLATVYTKAGKSNSGLLDLSFGSISPNDAVKLQDTQAFRVNPNGAVPPGPNDGDFSVNLTMPSGYSNPVGVYSVRTGMPAQSCVVSAGTYNNACSVDFTLITNGLGIVGGTSVDVTNYNRAASVQQTSPSISGCTGLYGAKDSGATSYTVNTCSNYAIQSATNTNTLETMTFPDIRMITSNEGQQTESTRLAFALINNLNIITVQFASTPTVTTLTPSSTGGTCTYTCTANNSNNDCDSSFPINFITTTPSCP